MKSAPLIASVSHLVKEVQFLGSYGTAGGTGKQLIYADGYAGLALLESRTPVFFNKEKASTLFLYGQTLKPLEVMYSGPFRMTVFFFPPYIIHYLFGIKTSELTDSCLDFDLVDPTISDRLLDIPETDKKIDCICEYLLDIEARRKKPADQRIRIAVHRIIEEGGNTGLAALRDELFISPRSFERHFQEQVGVTAGTYVKIARFRQVMNTIRTHQFTDLTDLAYSVGYTDQSHFIRQFREFTGQTPSAFLAQY